MIILVDVLLYKDPDRVSRKVTDPVDPDPDPQHCIKAPSYLLEIIRLPTVFLFFPVLYHSFLTLKPERCRYYYCSFSH